MSKQSFFNNPFITQKENETVKEQLRALSFCVHAVSGVPRKQRMSCQKTSFGNCIVLPTGSTSQKS